MYVARPAPRTAKQWLAAPGYDHLVDESLNTQLQESFPDAIRKTVVAQIGRFQKANIDDTVHNAYEENYIKRVIHDKQLELIRSHELVKNKKNGLRALVDAGQALHDHRELLLAPLKDELETINALDYLLDFGPLLECMLGSSDRFKYIGETKVFAVGVTVLAYLFCFFQLVLSSVSVETCFRMGAPPSGLEVRDAAGGALLKCGDLVGRCIMPIFERSTINLSAYLATRIFFYLFSLLPCVFLIVAARIRSRIVIDFIADTPKNDAQCMSHKTIMRVTFGLICVTHIVGSVITLAADIEAVGYFTDMQRLACPAVLNGAPDQCACRALYNPPRGAFHMPEVSGFQVKQVYDVAATVLFFNLVYTIWGVLFLVNYLIAQHRVATTRAEWAHAHQASDWNKYLTNCRTFVREYRHAHPQPA